MNKIKRIVSLALVLCMVMAFLPVGVSAAEDNSYAYNIVHVDAGRKYFTPSELKSIIDTAAESGFNQVQLYLSDNQGFRFALDDMSLTTAYGTYDLTPALGDGYSDNTGKAPDGTNKYLTEAEMDDIIAYANEKGIDIVPCINVPGHMGAILEAFTSFRYKKSNTTSKSSIDLDNDEAVAFALGLTEKYAEYFAARGCKFYNVGADEYANDLNSMGFEGMGSSLYTKFVQFLNDAAEIVKDLGMTPRAFNDGFYYKDYSISIEPDKAYEVCYWSSGWSGYDVAAASTIADKGHKMINTNGDYYWVLGNSSWQCSASKALQFSLTNFQGTTVSEPAGAMFCIWCDNAAADTAANVISNTKSVIEAFGSVLPAVESLVTEPEQPTEPTVPEDVTLTDEDTGIIVTVPGMTGLTVTEAAVPAIEGAAKALAWDIVPETAEGAYTGEGVVSIPVPADFNVAALGAFVVEADGSVKKLTGEYADGFYTYTCPHFSVTGIYEAEPAAEELEELEERTITVGLGATATDTIIGGEYSADRTDLDETIATVNVTTTPGQEATVEYTAVNGMTCSDLISSNATKQATNYYHLVSGSYYPVYATRTSSGNSFSRTYTYTWHYHNGTDYVEIGTQTGTSGIMGSNDPALSFTPYEKTGVEAVEAYTTVTFRGMALGTTYVTVGNVRYTIEVVAEDLNTVTPLTIEYWITNQHVTAGGAQSLNLSAKDAYGISGIEIAKQIPANGTLNSNAVAYWKTTCLDSDNQQTTGAGDDETRDGADFLYVRYYGGNWSYSADRTRWTNVAEGDQIVAYYLQVTEVTDEVTTQVSDYGNVPGYATGLSPFVMVDYAVKYESGEMSPSSFPTTKTIAFHCNHNSAADLGNTVIQDGSTYYRKLGTIKAIETAEYDVYMITLTPTSDTKTDVVASNANRATEYSYSGTEKVIWVDDEANLGNFASEDLHYTSPSGNITYTVGGEPNIPGLEVYKNQCMLVTYYVRAKATEDSLTVHYVDDTESVEFYSYNIAVKEGTYFKSNIGLNDPWKGNLANGDVVNFYGRTQYVSADLSTLSQVGAQYLYTQYKCIRVERSADGKDVYLYYTFDPTVSFVIDFGLPMEITATDLSEKLEGVTIEDMAFSGSAYTAYGQLTDKGTTVTYKPVKIMNGADYFTLQVTTDGEVGGILDEASNQIAFRVYVVPATTMHYEETFFSMKGFELKGSANADNQETELAGSKEVNYGFTGAYTDAGATNGTWAEAVVEGDVASASAEFTFTGDGVEVYVDANSSTGTMLALFHQNENGTETLTRLYQVDTEAKEGTEDVTAGQNTESYNLPAISVNGLDYGTYRVELMHTGICQFNETIKLDGFRVFNTLGNLSAAAYAESERNPEYLEVRDAVLSAHNVSLEDIDDEQHIINDLMSQVYANGEIIEGALVLSSSGKYGDEELKDLLNNGPKNELFLRKDESVTFELKDGVSAQIGLKALNDTTSFTINGTAGSITTSADMFYGEYTGKVTIVNTGDNILSVTKLKLFGVETAEQALAPIGEKLVKHALQCMGIIEKPVNPFADVTEDSFYFDAVIWAVENGITTGADKTHFLPDAICQRASVVTFLWRAAGSPEPETTVNPFVDVTEDAFFYKAVLWALENGITTGVDATHFAPFASCSRAQVVTFLWRANGCPVADAANPFADVAEGSFYYDAVLWAVANGVTNGMSSSIFGVESSCNRAQIVTFLYRADQLSK